MSKKLTQFSRPIVRRLPNLNLVVRFSEDGISIRAYRRRKWKRVTWSQIASLADETEPVIKVCEISQGLAFLKAMGATIVASSEVKADQ